MSLFRAIAAVGVVALVAVVLLMRLLQLPLLRLLMLLVAVSLFEDAAEPPLLLLLPSSCWRSPRARGGGAYTA